LDANMTKDTVERAIKRGAGALEGVNYEEIRYEGYGPGGVAIMVDCMTDNRNRTVAEVRHAFTKCGGNLGTDGSVAYLFEKQGILSYPEGGDEDRIMEVALEAGAEDVMVNDDGSIDVITDPDGYRGGAHRHDRARASSPSTTRSPCAPAPPPPWTPTAPPPCSSSWTCWTTWTTCRMCIRTPTSRMRSCRH
jgi:YebC/PmpR family DNA-binding regulatory protein